MRISDWSSDVCSADLSILQHAAQVSLEWFEHTDRYRDFAPIQLAFSLLSRSKRVTYDNLRLRDPGFIATVDRWFADPAARDLGSVAPAAPPPPPFPPSLLRGLPLATPLPARSA